MEVKWVGGKVVFDCNYCFVLWGIDGYIKVCLYYEELLEFVDIVLINEKDVCYIFGIGVGDYDRII